MVQPGLVLFIHGITSSVELGSISFSYNIVLMEEKLFGYGWDQTQ